MDKKGSFIPVIVVLILSLIIASFWDKIPEIKSSVHKILDPSAGALLNWDILIGMIILTFLVTFVTTLFQKYTTDQKMLKELKKEQKILHEEMKKYKDNPEKILEFNSKSLEITKKIFPLTMRPIIFTGIPIFLLFRWFMDYFSTMPGFKFFGYLSWFWFYLIFSIILSIFLRKILKVE